jgi:hypothetical protein
MIEVAALFNRLVLDFLHTGELRIQRADRCWVAGRVLSQCTIACPRSPRRLRASAFYSRQNSGDEMAGVHSSPVGQIQLRSRKNPSQANLLVWETTRDIFSTLKRQPEHCES